MKSEIKFKGVIAFIDILGFSDYFNVNSNGEIFQINLEDIRNKIIGRLIYLTTCSYLKVQHELNSFNSVKLGWLSFSDSIALYLPLGKYSPLSSPQLIIESMVYTCSLLMAHAIWSDIPLRGAISYGECLINKDPLYIIGKPFIEAANLEKKQKWAGIALADSASKYYDELKNNRIVKYDVPYKDGEKKRLMVVNWPGNSAGPATGHNCPDWDKCFTCSDINLQEKVKTKKKNTIDFFEHIHKDFNQIDLNVYFGPKLKSFSNNWYEFYQTNKPILE